MTIEEMDAHSAYLHAHHKKLRDELIDHKTREVARTKDPTMRAFYIRDLERLKAIGNGEYD
jgi:hypothetical protein